MSRSGPRPPGLPPPAEPVSLGMPVARRPPAMRTASAFLLLRLRRAAGRPIRSPRYRGPRNRSDRNRQLVNVSDPPRHGARALASGSSRPRSRSSRSGAAASPQLRECRCRGRSCQGRLATSSCRFRPPLRGPQPPPPGGFLPLARHPLRSPVRSATAPRSSSRPRGSRSLRGRRHGVKAS